MMLKMSLNTVNILHYS